MFWAGNMLSDINERPPLSSWYHTVIDCSCSSSFPVILCSIYNVMYNVHSIQIHEKSIVCANHAFIAVIMANKLASLTCKLFIADNVSFSLSSSCLVDNLMMQLCFSLNRIYILPSSVQATSRLGWVSLLFH